METSKALAVFGTILALTAAPLLLGVTGCATGNRYEQSTGERIDDHGTSSRVRSALADDPEYKYGGVNVETFKGTVQLSGFVNSKAQKDRAAELAKRVASVKEVLNSITVKELPE